MLIKGAQETTHGTAVNKVRYGHMVGVGFGSSIPEQVSNQEVQMACAEVLHAKEADP